MNCGTPLAKLCELCMASISVAVDTQARVVILPVHWLAPDRSSRFPLFESKYSSHLGTQE